MRITMLALLVGGALGWANADDAGGNWPQYRGSRASGIAAGSELAVRWDVEKGDNLLWKTRIPGLAHSAPIVWGDRIYLTTAVTEGEPELKIGLYGDIGAAADTGLQQWRLLAIDKATGELEFSRLGHEAVPRVKRHRKATHCNSTPATDGEHIVAIFGSEGLFCFDMGGELQWHKDLGPMDSGFFRAKTAQWGFASSPVIHDGKVVVLCDVQENSFIALFDLDDGRQIWRTPRGDVPTWGTPTVVEHEGATQILVNGWHHTGAYDFASGAELWKLDGGGDIPVPTPIVAHGKAYFTSAHGNYRPMRAIRLGAKGDITPDDIGDVNEAIAWVHKRRGNYMQTPIVVGDLLFGCDDNGVLTCFGAERGEIHYRERLGSGGGGFTASPVSDGEHLFFAGETGKVFVVPANDEFSVTATNELGESCLATPAVSAGVLFFRTRSYLMAIKGG